MTGQIVAYHQLPPVVLAQIDRFRPRLSHRTSFPRVCCRQRLWINSEDRWRAHCLLSWIRACNWRQTFLHRFSPCFWFKFIDLVKTWGTSITGPHRVEFLSSHVVDASSSRRRRELSWGTNVSIFSTRGGKYFSLSLSSYKKRCLKDLEWEKVLLEITFRFRTAYRTRDIVFGSCNSMKKTRSDRCTERDVHHFKNWLDWKKKRSDSPGHLRFGNLKSCLWYLL